MMSCCFLIFIEYHWFLPSPGASNAAHTNMKLLAELFLSSALTVSIATLEFDFVSHEVISTFPAILALFSSAFRRCCPNNSTMQ
jgi:3-methyladenine DNA glycosylase Tag